MRRHHSELQNEEVHTPGVARQRLALEMARAPHPDMRIQAGALGITRLQGVFSNLFPIQIAATSSNQTPVYHQYAVDFTVRNHCNLIYDTYTVQYIYIYIRIWYYFHCDHNENIQNEWLRP